MGDETNDSPVQQQNPGPRWKAILVVIGGIIVHLSLGASFIMGNFIPYITSYMRKDGDAPNIKQRDMVWVVAANSIGFGICMFLAGPIERKIGSRLCILLSSFLMSFSILISGYTVKKDLASFAITDGFMTGAAISIGYPTTLRVAMKWMPTWKSTVSGLVLAGHGGSSVIFTQVVTAYINPENFKPNRTSDGEIYFDQDILLDRVPWCFVMLGCTFVVIQIIGTAMISPPPKDEGEEAGVTSSNQNGYVQENGIRTVSVRTLDEAVSDKEKQTIESKTIAKEPVVHSFSPKKILKMRQFYILWFICILNGQSILFISGLYKTYGQTFINDDHFLAVVGSVAAVGNTLGRAMWGVFADRFGEKISFIAIACIVTALQGLINLSESVGKYYFLFMVFFMFLTGTGTYAVLSSATYKSFGPEYYSTNFGLIFTSQALAGILDSTLTTTLQAIVGWNGMFGISAGLTGVSVILSFLYTERVPVAPIASPEEQEQNGKAGKGENTPVFKENDTLVS